ncbi:MAG TPA: trigger factor [Terriglobia bacterium]|nr:trigger factor [Terriglobia bacterium]
MKVELTDISECKKSLDFEIPKDVVDHEIGHIAQEFARKAKVPGFRPGKAPITVIKTRYKEEILSEVMQHILPRSFSDAVKEKDLDLVADPHFENIDYTIGAPLKFKAVFEVYPQLNVSNYSGIPAQEVAATVEESEIETTLKKLQDDMSELTPVDEDREIREKDFAEISFHGTIQGSEEEPIAADKAVVEIGGASTLKDFTENLLGAKQNEEKKFSVTYDPNYPEKRLAGKTVDYHVKVESLKEKKAPELNDEFAQSLGDYKSLEDLRSKIRADMEKHKLEHAKEELREKLLMWLEDNNTFEVPTALVDRQIQIRMQRMVRELSRQGVNPQRLDVDWGKIREDQRQQSIRDVRGSLILQYVASKESIEVQDEELNEEIERIATEANKPTEKIREVLGRESGLARLRDQIMNKKTLDFLQERARIQPASAKQ